MRRKTSVHLVPPLGVGVLSPGGGGGTGGRDGSGGSGGFCVTGGRGPKIHEK